MQSTPHLQLLAGVFPSLTLPNFSTQGREDLQTDPQARSRIGFDTMLGVRPQSDSPAQTAQTEPEAKTASKAKILLSSQKKGDRRGSRKAK